MSSVDNRVVQMEFDNKRFESNVKESMSTLDKLKKALDFSKESDSMDQLSKASNMLNLNHISSALDKVTSKFSLLGQIGYQAISRIAGKVVDLGEQMLKTVFVDQIGAGMSKYEAETNAVQTMAASLKDTGKGLKEIYETLDLLMNYADMTSYSYAQMTEGMSRFINSGVGLEQAERSMEGIANLAAISGVSIRDTEVIFRNFADAMSAHVFRSKDWMSVEKSIGTKAFKEQVIETAKALGKLDKEGYVLDEHGKRVSKNAVTIENFKQMLETGFFDDKVMLAVLEKYADRTGDLGKEAYAAAQNAKTFTDVMDSIKDAASTGWSKSFRLIFGDMKEATEFFTPMADAFIGVVNEIDDFRNNILQGWRDLNGRETLIDGLKILWENFLEVKRWFSTAASFVFGNISGNPLLSGNVLADLTQKFKDFAQAIKDWMAGADPETGTTHFYKFFNIIRGLLSVVDFVKQIFGGIKTFVHNVMDQLAPTFEALLSFFMVIGNTIFRTNEKIKSSGKITDIANNLANALKPLTERLPAVVRGMQAMFLKMVQFFRTNEKWKSFASAMSNAFHRIVTGIPKAITSLIDFGKSVIDSMKASGSWERIVEHLKNAVQMIMGFFRSLATAIGNFFSTDTSGLTGFWEKLKARFAAFGAAFADFDLGEKIRDFVTRLGNGFKAMFEVDTSGIDGLKNKIATRLQAFWDGFSGALKEGWETFKAEHPIGDTVSEWLTSSFSGNGSGSFTGILNKFFGSGKGGITGKATKIVGKALKGKGGMAGAIGTLLIGAGWTTDTIQAMQADGSDGTWHMAVAEEIASEIVPEQGTIKAAGMQVLGKFSKDMDKTMPGLSTAVTGLVEGALTLMDAKNKKTLSSTEHQSVLDVLKGFFTNSFDTLKTAFTKVSEFVSGIDFKPIFEFITNVLKIVMMIQVIRTMGNIGKSFKNVGNSISNFFGWMQNGGLKGLITGATKKEKTLGEKIKTIALTVAGIVASFVLIIVAINTLASMPFETFKAGGLRLLAIIGVIAMFMIGVNKLSGTKGQKNDKFAVSIGSMLGIVVAVIAFYKVIEAVSKMNETAFFQGYGRVVAILVAIAAFYILAEGVTSKIKGGSASKKNAVTFGSFVGLVAAVWLFGKMVASFAAMGDTFWDGFEKLAAIIGAIAFFYAIAEGLGGAGKGNKKKNTASFGSMLGLVAVVWLFSELVISFSQMNDSDFWNGFEKLAAIMGSIAAFFLLADGINARIGGGKGNSFNIITMAGVVAAVWLLGELVGKFSKMEDFWDGYVKMAAIMVAFGIIAVAFGRLIAKINKMSDPSIKTVIRKGLLLGVGIAAIWGLMELLKTYMPTMEQINPGNMIAFTASIILLSGALAIILMAMDNLKINNDTKFKNTIQKILETIAAFAVVAGVMYVFSEILKNAGTIDPISALAFAGSMILIGTAAYIIMRGLNNLDVLQYSWKDVFKKITIMIGAAIGISIMMWTFGKVVNNANGVKPSKMLAFAASSVIMAFAASIMIAAIDDVKTPKDWNETLQKCVLMVAAGLAVSEMLIAFSLFADKISGIDAGTLIVYALTAAVMAGAAGIMILAISKLPAAKDWKELGIKAVTMIVAAAAVSGMLIALASFAEKVKDIDPGTLSAFAATTVIMAGAMMIILGTIGAIDIKGEDALTKIGSIIATALAVAGLMWVFSEVVGKAENIDPGKMLAFAGSMVLLAVAVDALLLAISNIKMDATSIVLGALAILLIGGALGLVMDIIASVTADAIQDFGSRFTELGQVLSTFNSVTTDVDTDHIEKMLGVLDQIKTKMVEWGTASYGDITKFRREIALIGSSLKLFKLNTESISDTESFTSVLQNIEAMGNSIRTLEGLPDLEVDNTIANIGAAFRLWAVSMNDAMTELGEAGITTENLPDSGLIGAALKAMAGALADDDVLAAFAEFAPDDKGKQMNEFAFGMTNISTALGTFAKDTASINVDDIMKAVGVLNAIAGITGELVESESTVVTAVGVLGKVSAEISQQHGNLTDFSNQIVLLGPALKDFGEQIQDVDVDKCSHAADVLNALAKIEVPKTGGVVQFLEGVQDITLFSNQLPLLGKGILDFANNVKGYDGNADEVKKAAEAIATVAIATSRIPKTGGLEAFLSGESNLDKFAENLPKLGTGIANFANNIGSTKITDDHAKAAEVLGTVITAFGKIPKTGGLFALFGGDIHVDNFANDMYNLGTGIAQFVKASELYGDLDPSYARSVASVFQTIASGFAKLENVDKAFDRDYPGKLYNLGVGIANFVAGSKHYGELKTDSIAALGALLLSIGEFLTDVKYVADQMVKFDEGTLLSNMSAAGKSIGSFLDGLLDSSVYIKDAPTLDEKLEILKKISDSVVGLFTATANLFEFTSGITIDEDKQNELNALFEALAIGLGDFYISTKDLTFDSEALTGINGVGEILKSLSEFDTSDNVLRGLSSIATIMEHLNEIKGLEGVKIADIGNEIAGFVNNLSTITEVTDDQLQTIAQVMAYSFGTIAAQFADHVSDSINDSVENTKSHAYEKSANAITENISTELKNKQHDFVTCGLNILLGIKDGIVSNLGILTPLGEQMANTIKSSFTNAVDENSPSRVFMGYGRYIVEGLRIGIDNNTGLAAKAAISLASRTLQAFRDKMGIHSPSWEMYLSGLDVTNGLAKGMDDGADYVDKTSKKLGDVIQDDIDETVDDAQQRIEKGSKDVGKSAEEAIAGTAKMIQWGKKSGYFAGLEEGFDFNDIFSDMSEAYAEAMKKAAEATEEGADAAEDAKEEADKATNGSSGKGTKGVKAAVSSMQDYTADLTRIVSTLISIDDRMEEMLGKMGTYFSFEMARGIDQNGSAVIDSISSLASNIIYTFENSLDSGVMNSLGLFAVLGWANGVTGNSFIASDAMEYLGEIVIDALRDVLGIHSPSEEFADAGELSVRGYEEGVENELKHLGDATANLFADTLFSDDISPYEQGKKDVRDYTDGILDGMPAAKRKEVEGILSGQYVGMIGSTSGGMMPGGKPDNKNTFGLLGEITDAAESAVDEAEKALSSDKVSDALKNIGKQVGVDLPDEVGNVIDNSIIGDSYGKLKEGVDKVSTLGEYAKKLLEGSGASSDVVKMLMPYVTGEKDASNVDYAELVKALGIKLPEGMDITALLGSGGDISSLINLDGFDMDAFLSGDYGSLLPDNMLNNLNGGSEALGTLGEVGSNTSEIAKILEWAKGTVWGEGPGKDGVDYDHWLSDVMKDYYNQHPDEKPTESFLTKMWDSMFGETPSGVNESGSGSGGGSGGGRNGMNNGASASMAAGAYIDYSADLARIISELQSMNDRVEFLTDTMTNLQIVMDTGALVGSTSAAFDQSLGVRTGYAERGIGTD